MTTGKVSAAANGVHPSEVVHSTVCLSVVCCLVWYVEQFLTWRAASLCLGWRNIATKNEPHDWRVSSVALFARSALVYDNLVEDNARAGIFFHRSTDYAEAYNNTCRRNLEGDFGIVESTGVKVYDNVMEVSAAELRAGLRLS